MRSVILSLLLVVASWRIQVAVDLALAAAQRPKSTPKETVKVPALCPVPLKK